MALHRPETRVGGAKRKRLAKDDEPGTAKELIPGIPDEIALHVIAAKFLTWRDVCVLSSVSRGWCQAVRSREVYRSRLGLQSSEILSLGYSKVSSSQQINEVSLHSKRNNYSYQLPLIPGLCRMPVSGCVHAPLDGKLYVLGGELKGTQGKDRFRPFSKEVYMLDLAGRKEWKRCASMKDARGAFGGAVWDGKIYVFGGCQNMSPRTGVLVDGLVCGSEVYDPQKNTWTSIKAMPKVRSFHHVIEARTIQGEPVLVMYGGLLSHLQKWNRSGEYTSAGPPQLEIYHPRSDRWRVVSPNEILPAGETTSTRTPTTMGDPSSFIDWLNGTHLGPRPYLSL